MCGDPQTLRGVWLSRGAGVRVASSRGVGVPLGSCASEALHWVVVTPLPEDLILVCLFPRHVIFAVKTVCYLTEGRKGRMESLRIICA